MSGSRSTLRYHQQISANLHSSPPLSSITHSQPLSFTFYNHLLNIHEIVSSSEITLRFNYLRFTSFWRKKLTNELNWMHKYFNKLLIAILVLTRLQLIGVKITKFPLMSIVLNSRLSYFPTVWSMQNKQ